MITITEDYEIIFSEEAHEALNEVAIKIGDEIKHMQPLEKYYVLKTACEEIDARCTMYSLLGMIKDGTSNDGPAEA